MDLWLWIEDFASKSAPNFLVALAALGVALVGLPLFKRLTSWVFPTMAYVAPPPPAPEPNALVMLLLVLFPRGLSELVQALQRTSWGLSLVRSLQPHDRTPPADWCHQLAERVHAEGHQERLLDLLRQLRKDQVAEIDAVERLLERGATTTQWLEARRSPPVERPLYDRLAPPPAEYRHNVVHLNAQQRPPPRVSPVSRPAWRRVRVIHLSDLHFSAKTAWDSGTVLGRLVVDVARLRGEVGGIDLVVVTGDIATTGADDEYAQATTWLTGPLATAAGVTPAQIRVVPGNHDVHRGSITRSARMLADGLLADGDPQQAFAEVLGSEAERAPLLSRQATYLTFAQTFHPGLTVPWWFERSEIHGLTVHLAGFNSAWLSASDGDRGNLVLSRWLCHQLLAGAEDADLTIALLHHPWDYLHEHDQESEEEIRRRCGLILNGHLHQQKARLASDPDRDVLQLAAGASYAGSKWANAYQLIELDPIRGEAHAHFRVWDGHDWIPDRNRYQKAPDGVATLPLRRSPRAGDIEIEVTGDHGVATFPLRRSPKAKTPAELALSRLFNEEFTTPAINAWLTADPRRALARSALKRANEDQQDPFDLLAVTLTQLGLVDEALFTSLMAERPQSADAVAEAARTSGVPLPPIARSLAAQAKSVDKRSRYSRLELVVELEELQKRRARSQRDKHDHRKLDQEIDDVVRRLAKAPSPRRGAVVAGATLEEEVARGAFGTVWRGRAPDGQTVAVKVFRPEQLKAHMAVWGFRRGVRAMRLFEQRKGPASLVRVLSVSEDELAFTMPFIDGATLEATDLTGWTLAQRLDCFQAIGEAIQFSHDERVIHRDLKPANIMIDRAGAPVVIDFDAADVGHATLLSMAINVGTLGYMAPEQSSAPRASVLMDVYSLGRVLHYLLLGRHSAMSVAHEPVVRSELAAAPPALVELVLRACNLSPEARPASVAELLRELSVARAAQVAAEPDAQRAAEPPAAPRRPATRRLEPLVVAAAERAATPEEKVNVLWREAAPLGPPAHRPVSTQLPTAPPPLAAQQAPPPLPVSERAAESPPPQPPPPSEAPRSSAPVAEAVTDFTSSTSGFVAVNPVAPEQTPPSWAWRGFGAVVVVLSVVGAWVKLGGEEDTPVEPVTGVEATPIIGPCGVPLLGGPTGETHTPNIEGLDMPFVGLSAGQFCMGSPVGVGYDDERPQHPVQVAGCLMGKSEVTQAQWRTVVKAAKIANDVDAAGLNEDPSSFKGDKLPVECVSWCDVTRFANALSRLDGRDPVYEIADVTRFANALSRLDGRDPVYEITDRCEVRWIDGADGYRLPTEAEWEYATRAGMTTTFATGADEAALALAGWYGAVLDDGGNSGGKTHDVCTAPKQPWGLCDLHGNVWEWVFDVYGSDTYSRRAAALTVDGGPSTFDGSATLAGTAGALAPRVRRGGSWHDEPRDARSANRDGDAPSDSVTNLGFRLLLPPTDQP